MLVVPLTGKHGKVKFREVRIEAGERWKNNHWRTIRSAYAKSPFFEHYAEDLNKVIFTGFEFLHQLNTELLSMCLKNTGLIKTISETVAYTQTPGVEISDLRSVINLKAGYAARSIYQPVPYYQVFGNAFAGNLSLIDLLFCEGPNARNILKASEKKI